MNKTALLAALAVISTSAAAEQWSAIGILTTQIKGQEAKVQYVEIDNFESEELCRQVVLRESYSEDYIGIGGTNHKLPSVQWNYDANCVLKRAAWEHK